MRGRVFAIVIAVGLGSTVLRAQDTLPVAPGDRVRVHASNLPEGWVTGTLAAITADTIHLVRSGSTAAIAVPRVFVFELQLARQRSLGAGMARGARIGAFAGGVVLGVVGYASGDDRPCSGGFGLCFSFSAETKALLGLIGGGVGGGIVGGVVGAAFPGTHWESIYEAGRVAPIARVSGNGVQVGVRIGH